MNRLFLFLVIIVTGACNAQSSKAVVGAERLDILLPELAGKRIALVVNQTSIVGKTHLADTLKSKGVNIVKIFSPEHGFRGNAADGELVNDSVDVKTGIALVSLYGKNYKPTPAMLADVDIVIFDVQDVGARFYTYVSTLTWMMETCADTQKNLIILDRPNPNGNYVDGPILEPALKSIIGLHPIPIVHGMTVGEIAGMINEEGWLENKKKCALKVITIKNWKHADEYLLPVPPSPNLPNNQSIRLYPSICLFEGTVISLGRGTPMPFQVLGNPELKEMPFQFTPVPIKGFSLHPPQEGKLCYGIDLRAVRVDRKLDLSYLLKFYQAYPDKEKFFIPYFDKLAGTNTLKQQIKDGLTEAQIRESWKKGLEEFKVKREKYLLYQ
ncbi:MAG: DUF1343 domain-containing protein [Cyclobacteriaceae bacterium]|nr:DUF1343 domain-containing protein [Cyclobacteriaceae bacterium]